MSSKYANLFAVANSIAINSKALKVIAVLAAVGGIGGGYLGASNSGRGFEPQHYMLTGLGVVLGLACWGTAVLFAAVGEGMLCLHDIAVNTTPPELPKAEKPKKQTAAKAEVEAE